MQVARPLCMYTRQPKLLVTLQSLPLGISQGLHICYSHKEIKAHKGRPTWYKTFYPGELGVAQTSWPLACSGSSRWTINAQSTFCGEEWEGELYYNGACRSQHVFNIANIQQSLYKASGGGIFPDAILS